MILRIELEKEEMEKILSSCGYKIYDITAWYTPMRLEEDDELLPINVRVAYKDCEDMSEIKKEKPMMVNLEHRCLDNMVNMLVKKAMLYSFF